MNNLNEEQKAASAKLLSLRADRHEDVRFLAEVIDGLGKEIRPIFAAAMIELGLMQFHDRMIRLAVAFCKWRGRPVYGALVTVFRRFPQMTQDFIEATAEHVLHGTDKTSVTSVGGWSQDEMNQAARILVEIAIATLGQPTDEAA